MARPILCNLNLRSCCCCCWSSAGLNMSVRMNTDRRLELVPRQTSPDADVIRRPAEIEAHALRSNIRRRWDGGWWPTGPRCIAKAIPQRLSRSAHAIKPRGTRNLASGRRRWWSPEPTSLASRHDLILARTGLPSRIRAARRWSNLARHWSTSRRPPAAVSCRRGNPPRRAGTTRASQLD